MNRRGFLSSCLALGAAPMIVRASSLMKIIVPPPEKVGVILSGEFNYGMVSEEMAAITRRASVPGMVQRIYKNSPMMRRITAGDAADRLLSFDPDCDFLELNYES